ncbi:uncharacterized protein PADG_07439 [Paracoccidioides brasiliensis Pb18]|uniref:RNA-dependent RNA polymerase n=1 Tax=Paracoccidioides brasiliensis (strain Pb18) TaxID=502780 RepID=C1GJK3_PARBD|nr:uncharacterized protein PADG_07439 [Paracoccidioides brasiliensis Pb18]EEH42619.1 hypothetical protein PADG_07439 [Paracoccidioides brasiliensis Pb18]
MATPRTPKSSHDFNLLINNLNVTFNLDLPNPAVSTPKHRPGGERTFPERCVGLMKFLYYNNPDNVQRVIDSFQEWARAFLSDWVPKTRQEPGTLPSSRPFIRSNALSMARNITPEQRAKVLDYLWTLLRDEEYIVTRGASRISKDVNTTPSTEQSLTELESGSPAAFAGGSISGSAIVSPDILRKQTSSKMTSPSKRKSDINDSEVFVTAPNSPSHSFHITTLSSDDEFEYSDLDNFDIAPIVDSVDSADSSDNNHQKQGKTPQKAQKQRRIEEFMTISKKVQSTFSPPSFGKTPLGNQNSEHNANTSFSTIASQPTSLTTSFGASTVATSVSPGFGKNLLIEILQGPSTIQALQSEEATALFDNASFGHKHGLDCREDKIRNIIRDLEENGPFSKQYIINSTVPLRYRYEAQRAAHSRRIPVETLLEKVDQDRRKLPEYEDFWNHLHDGLPTSLEKTKSGPWEMAVEMYEDKRSTGDVVTLSGKLSWCKRKGYFDLSLNPLKFERSYRFCRRFGSDRFLEITFPVLTSPPSRLARDTEERGILLEAISRWLANSEHHLLGRVWRSFYLEDVKEKSKRTPRKNGIKMSPELETGSKRSRVFMFAINGTDFGESTMGIPLQDQTSGNRTKMSIDALINWHMPIADNIHQSDCKLFQRLALGLSRTLSTVVLRREEVIFCPDPPGPVMNDGCALMSRSLGLEIKRILDLETLPACYQGRISGAKGIWMVDRDDSRFKGGDRDFGLEITESQLKISYPHGPPHNPRLVADNTQLTFEVVQWSQPLNPSSLNLQVLKVLQHGGVGHSHIKKLIQQEVSIFYKEFLKVIHLSNGVACRKWLQKMKRFGDDGYSYKRQTRRIDNFFPSQYVEQAVLLLDSGFLPLKLPYLTQLFRRILKDYLDSLRKLKVSVSQSTYAYCIADPLGVLSPDEVHFGFSHKWDDGSVVVGTELHDMNVLVARLPAHLPTDIQKRRAVYKNELRHFKDVIVFPTTGDVPLASLLSGGDYDGDQCWVCWDPIIVREFSNSHFDPTTIPSSEQLGLVCHSLPMNQVRSIDQFLAKVFLFNAKPSQLGPCTIEHETFCYHNNDLGCKGAVMLAWLLSYLVDSKKAGLELPGKAWRRLRAEYMPVKLEQPAYKTFDHEKRNSSNIIDYLLFDVIKAESDRILEDFDRFCEEHSGLPIDPHLVDAWNKAEQRAANEKQGGKLELYDALQGIKRKLRNVKEEWDAWKKLTDNTSYAMKIAEAAQRLQKVQPPSFEHDLSYTWRNSQYEWERFRASCAYKDSRADFVWYAAGPILCEMKARALGGYRMVENQIYSTLKVNRNSAKRAVGRILRRKSGEESDCEYDDEDFDADESLFVDLDENINDSRLDEE